MGNRLIHKKIDEVMQSIDGIKRATPRPFLFTRLEAAMANEKNVWVKVSSYIARPLVAFICICLIIMINVMAVFFFRAPVNRLAQQANELANVDEYSQASATLYELENVNP
jgi:hypothetical protein